MLSFSFLRDSRILIGLATVCVIVYPLIVALSFDMARSYTTTPDADILYLSEALRFLDGLNQTYYDHPGHTYMMVLGYWLKMTALIGLTPVPSHATAVSIEDIDGYVQSLTVSARALSAFLTMCFTGMVIWGCRQLGARPWISVFSGLLFATSIGVASTSLYLRAEIWSSFFTVACFLFLVVADNRAGKKQFVYLVVAGLAAMLAMESKIQAFIPLLGIPILIIVRAKTAKSPHRIDLGLGFSGYRIFAVAVIVPLIALWGQAYMSGLPSVARSHYQILVLFYLAVSILCYTRIRHLPFSNLFDGSLAFLLGIALGTYFIFFWFSDILMDMMVFPVEFMTRFSRISQHHGFSVDTALFILDIFAKRILQGINNSSFLVELVAMALIGWLAYRKKWWPAAFLFLLLGFSFSLETLFGLRWFPVFYSIYTHVWVVFAIAVGLEFLIDYLGRPALYWGAALALLIVGMNISAGLDKNLLFKQPDDHICRQSQGYLAPEFSARFKKYCY